MDNDDIYESLVSGKKDKRREILDQLQELDIDTYSEQTSDSSFLPDSKSSIPTFLPSSMTKKKKNTFEDKSQDEDQWFNELMNSSDIKIKKAKRQGIFEDMVEGATGKKKKKKKDKNELTDYKKEFEPEAALYRNLLIDQTKFVDSLQKQYDYLNSHKASSRGVTKNMTDLIETLNAARSLSMQLVDKHINLKKTIADLTMKERKEKLGINGDEENLSDFASNYLKQMISDRNQFINGTGSSEIGNYTTDEMANLISDNLTNSDDFEERSPEVDSYLKYENRNVTIYVYMNQNDEEDYEYVAIAEDGEQIDDYPLPFKGNLSINRSTSIATDQFGQKYPIRWQ